jgi:hypothetical protein
MPRKQQPKRYVRELSAKELRRIVRDIQETLWCEEYADDEQRSTGSGVHKYWDAEKPLDCICGRRSPALQEIATVLENYGLKPIDPPVVQAFDSIDEFIEALPNDTPPDEQPFPEIDRSDSDDPDYWQGQPGGNPPTS